MSERVSFSALKDTLNNSEYEEQPLVSNSADATLRRQEKEIQRLKKANFNLKLQVFHLEEKLGLLPNDFEGDATNKSTLSMEDSGLQSPKTNLLQVLEEKEREVAQRDELLKKARKVIFSLQEKIKELYERRQSLQTAPVEKETIANGDKYSRRHDETWPNSLSETFQVFRKRWNYLAEKFPEEISSIPKETVISHDWTALENIFHHVIDTLPLFQKLLKNSENVDCQSPIALYDNQKSPNFTCEFGPEIKKAIQPMQWAKSTDPPSPLHAATRDIHNSSRSPEKPRSNRNVQGRPSLEMESLYKLQDKLLRFAEIRELGLPQLSTRSNIPSSDIVSYLEMIFEQTHKLQERTLKLKEEIQEKETEVEEALLGKKQVEESLETLQNEREQLLQQVANMEAELDDSVYYYRNENEKLSDELDNVKQELSETKSYYEQELNHQTDKLKERGEYYENEIASLSQQLAETKAQLEESTNRFQDILDRQRNEFNEMQESYQEQISGLSHELEKSAKEFEEKQEGYEADIARINEELEQVNNQLEETEQHYQEENRQLAEELDRRTNELQEMQCLRDEETARLSHELEQTKFQLKQLENQYQNQNVQQLEDFEKQRKEWEDVKEEYEMDIARLSDELERITNEREEMVSRHREEITRLQEELNQQAVKMKEKQQEYENEAYQLVEQLNATKQQFKEAESRYQEENKRTLNELEQVRSRLEEELSKAKQYEKLSMLVNEYEEWFQVLQADNEHHYELGQPVDCILRRQLLSEIDEQNSRIAQYESQLERLKLDCEVLFKEKTSLSISNQETEEENSIYREQNQIIQKEMEQLENHKEELQFQNATLKQQTQLIAQELEKCRCELNENKEQVNKLTSKINEDAIITETLRKNNETAERELESIRGERDKMKQTLETDKIQIQSLTVEISKLKLKLTSLEQSCRTKEDELESASQEKQQLLEQLEAARNEIEAAYKKYENQSETLNVLQRNLSEKEVYVKNLQSELTQKETQLHMLSKELEESSSEHEMLQRRLRELESKQSEMEGNVSVPLESKCSEYFATPSPDAENTIPLEESRVNESNNVGKSSLSKHPVDSHESYPASPSEAPFENRRVDQPEESYRIAAVSPICQQSESSVQVASVSRDKNELEQLLRQKEYENLVLQQETESYYEEWKKIEKESEMLRTMLRTLQDEQLESRKYVLELREVIEALFETDPVQVSSVKQKLQQNISRLLDKFLVDASHSATGPDGTSGNTAVFHNTTEVGPPSSWIAKTSSFSSYENDWNDPNDLDENCQHILSLFSHELQNLQNIMQQLSENIPPSILCDNDVIPCSGQLPDMIVTGHTVEFEELGTYIHQLTQLLAGFRKVAVAARQALLSEKSIQNISVYEVSQPAFGKPTATNSESQSLSPQNSLLQANETTNRNEREMISQVATEALAAKNYLMKGIDNFDTRVEQVLESIGKRLSFLSEKQKNVSKQLHKTKMSIPWRQSLSGENLFGNHKVSSLHKSEQNTWENVALKQIEETQRLITSAHQRLACEKARLIQSVFGQATE